jgi:hypothetical protein
MKSRPMTPRSGENRLCQGNLTAQNGKIPNEPICSSFPGDFHPVFMNIQPLHGSSNEPISRIARPGQLEQNVRSKPRLFATPNAKLERYFGVGPFPPLRQATWPITKSWTTGTHVARRVSNQRLLARGKGTLANGLILTPMPGPQPAPWLAFRSLIPSHLVADTGGAGGSACRPASCVGPQRPARAPAARPKPVIFILRCAPLAHAHPSRRSSLVYKPRACRTSAFAAVSSCWNFGLPIMLPRMSWAASLLAGRSDA